MATLELRSPLEAAGRLRGLRHCLGPFSLLEERRREWELKPLARVLTVEDNPIVRADLRLVLEDAGFDVCADARDGIEAIELARVARA